MATRRSFWAARTRPQLEAATVFEKDVDHFQEGAHGRRAVSSEPARQLRHGNLQSARQRYGTAEELGGANERGAVGVFRVRHLFRLERMACAVCALPHEKKIRRDDDVVIPRQPPKLAGEQTQERSPRSLSR